MILGRASRDTGCCLNSVSVRGLFGAGDVVDYCARRYCLSFSAIAGFLWVCGSGLRWCMVSRPVLGLPCDTPLHQ
eukprot:4441419-Pyramimonas_sp.AAC.1